VVLELKEEDFVTCVVDDLLALSLAEIEFVMSMVSMIVKYLIERMSSK
jgi:hypothetical protein